jgi:hypothetical protein
MDYRAADAVLLAYEQAVKACDEKPMLPAEREAAIKDLDKHIPKVNRVLAQLTPDHHQLKTGSSLRDHKLNIRFVNNRARDLIEFSHMVNLEEGPSLSMFLLDDVVYQAAKPPWESGHYRSAVSDAAIAVSQATQLQVHRHDISERELLAHAFSAQEPKPGEGRLRCPGNPASQSVQSQQQGALLFAMGCYQAIRNPANHLAGDWNPVTAFHHLVALSMIAGWVRTWAIAYTPPSV